MRVRLVGVALLKVIERSGNGGNTNEENDKIHDDLLLKKRHAKQKNAASPMIWIKFSPILTARSNRRKSCCKLMQGGGQSNALGKQPLLFWRKCIDKTAQPVKSLFTPSPFREATRRRYPTIPQQGADQPIDD